VTGKSPTRADAAAPEHEAPAAEEVSTFRLMATLTVAGALAGLLIVLVNLHTKPIIDAYKAEQLQQAIYEVMPGVVHYETYYLVDGALSLKIPDGAKESEFKRIYLGYDANDRLKGVAVSRGESGFQDVIQLIFSFDPATRKLLGMKILDSKETPGLGDKIYKDQAFASQFFIGLDTPLIPVKIGAGKGQPGEIDTITGATISSKAVINIINHGLDEWVPILERGIPPAPEISGKTETAEAKTGTKEATQ
jgi:electron transport complex protein RnfG